MHASTVAFVVGGLTLAIAMTVESRQPPTVPDPIAGYRTWKKLNDKPVYMLPMVASLCIGPFYWDAQPTNPHVPNYFNVYVNKVGQDTASSKNADAFPAGTVIVKEKLAGKNHSDLKLLTVMIKHAKGYDKAHGDWEYMTVASDLIRRSHEKKAICQSCHQAQKQNDYVFGTYSGGFVSRNRLDYSKVDRGTIPRDWLDKLNHERG